MLCSWEKINIANPCINLSGKFIAQLFCAEEKTCMTVLQVSMFGKDVKLGPGDMVEIPIGVQHGVQVLGTDPVVMFESVIVDFKVSRWVIASDGTGWKMLPRNSSRLGN